MHSVSFGISDRGIKRPTNQDIYFIDNDLFLYIVADGMGGHKGGDTAAGIVKEELPRYIRENHQSDATGQLLVRAVKHVNEVIYREARNNEEINDMGTTVTALLVKGDTAFIANVGDSRCYLYGQEQIFQVSRDHTLLQEKIRLGMTPRHQALEDDPMANALVRTVGYEENVLVDIFRYKYLEQQIFLLCSDGLYNKLSDRDLVNFISGHLPRNLASVSESDLEGLGKAMVATANERGGQDNISLIFAVICR